MSEVGEKKLRGFAAMDPERRRAMGRKGGKMAHENGTAHEFTSEEAVEAVKELHKAGKVKLWTSESARRAGIKGIEAKRVKYETANSGVSDQPTE
jgi:hypothetical protein